jgi:NTE family protein
MFGLFKKPRKLGISLSGGGAKSVIYLGVLKALEDNGITIEVIAGLSGGSLIAGLIGSGKTVDQVIDIATGIDYNRLLDLNPFDGFELVDQAKFYDLVKSFAGDKRFEDCITKTIIFTTDLNARKAEIITSGELASAMVSSCCLPPVLQPFLRDGKLLAEGGFTVYYGAQYLRAAGAEVVIGSDVDGFNSFKLPGIIEALRSGISATINSNSEYEKRLFPVDIEIKNFPDHTSMFEFQKAGRDLVKLGYEHTLEFMPQIKKLVHVK